MYPWSPDGTARGSPDVWDQKVGVTRLYVKVALTLNPHRLKLMTGHKPSIILHNLLIHIGKTKVIIVLLAVANKNRGEAFRFVLNKKQPMMVIGFGSAMMFCEILMAFLNHLVAFLNHLVAFLNHVSWSTEIHLKSWWSKKLWRNCVTLLSALCLLMS